MSEAQSDLQSSTQRPNAVQAASAVLDDGRLVELVYDPAARRTGFVVGKHGRWQHVEAVDAGGGERLAPVPPHNNLLRHDVLLLPTGPEEYGSEEDLVAEIESFLHRYVAVSAQFERIASHYVLLSWVYDAFNELPYLRARGAYGTGKTRFLLVVGSLCYKAFFASGASTVSPIFHTLDAFGGTLVIDEADFRFSDEKADVVKILNNGNVRGLPVLRTLKNSRGIFNPQAFRVFGPKLVATRGSYDDPGLESRFITEDMGRCELRPDVPINLPSQYQAEACRLRNKLLLYRLRTRGRVKVAEHLVDRGVEARLSQIFVPLLSVVRDEELQDEVCRLASRYHSDLVAERALEPEAQVLEALRDLTADGASGHIAVKRVVDWLREHYPEDYAEKVTPKWVGWLLRRQLGIQTRKSHGVFVVPFTELPRIRRLCERYGMAGTLAEDGSSPGSSGGGPDGGTAPTVPRRR